MGYIRFVGVTTTKIVLERDGRPTFKELLDKMRVGIDVQTTFVSPAFKKWIREALDDPWNTPSKPARPTTSIPPTTSMPKA